MTKLEFEKITIKGAISYLKSWVETMQDRIAKEDPKTLLCEVYEERIAFLTKAIEILSDEKCIRLPVPIGEPIYVPYRFETEEGVDIFTLTGYYVLDEKQYYVVYNDVSKITEDIPVEDTYFSQQEAEERLKMIRGKSKIGKQKSCKGII